MTRRFAGWSLASRDDGIAEAHHAGPGVVEVAAEDHAVGLLAIGRQRTQRFLAALAGPLIGGRDRTADAERGKEPLRTLATYRRLDGAGVAFGIYAAVAVAGTLRLGDPVVLDRRS